MGHPVEVQLDHKVFGVEKLGETEGVTPAGTVHGDGAAADRLADLGIAPLREDRLAGAADHPCDDHDGGHAGRHEQREHSGTAGDYDGGPADGRNQPSEIGLHHAAPVVGRRVGHL